MPAADVRSSVPTTLGTGKGWALVCRSSLFSSLLLDRLPSEAISIVTLGGLRRSHGHTAAALAFEPA